MTQFDPSTAISSDLGIFGLPVTYEESRIVMLPVPWEVTTSYGAGASLGPKLVRQASEQIDLFDFEVGKAYEAGYFMKDYPEEVKSKNDTHKKLAQDLIEMISHQSGNEKKETELRAKINKACAEMVDWVYRESKKILADGKILALVGGDHSTPLGAIKAISESQKGADWGVLHIDAHADLREAYQGLTHSHASIMYNVMTSPFKPTRLVQVGIRDFCEEEYDMIESRPDIKTFFDIAMKKRLLKGESWVAVCRDIIAELPQNVYISFDIDGLEPVFCPHTGTPVPGGLSVDQLFCLFSELAASGRRIIGFDLNEVSSGGLSEEEAEWDGNVGARVLFKMCGWTIKTNA